MSIVRLVVYYDVRGLIIFTSDRTPNVVNNACAVSHVDDDDDLFTFNLSWCIGKTTTGDGAG